MNTTVIIVFELGEFLGSPSVDRLNDCKKADLWLIAEHYKIDVLKTALKANNYWVN